MRFPKLSSVLQASKQGLPIRRVAETAEVTQKSQVGSDSLVGEYTKIAEKSSVKRSIIGAHCVIGKNVKIANSIIMDHVVLEDSYVFVVTALNICQLPILLMWILQQCQTGWLYRV